jgi:hypothetical protein
MIEPFAIEAIGLGADRLEVEYKDGHEWVFVVSGSLGVGIGQFRSSSPEGTRLREECYQLARKRRWHAISLDGHAYEVRCAIHDSFGEDAFRLLLRPASTTGSEVSARTRRKRTS